MEFHCWMQDSNPEGLWKRTSSRLNARWQTEWAIGDQAQNLNSKALPYDQSLGVISAMHEKSYIDLHNAQILEK